MSSVPSAFSRPRHQWLWPPNMLNPPPTTIFPSACTASEYDITVRSGIETGVQRPVGIEPANDTTGSGHPAW